MPHFVIECSESLIGIHSSDVILQQVHRSALESGLFKESDVKVRLNAYKNCLVGGTPQNSFIHVFATIMEGRTTDQKAQLARTITTGLTMLFPSGPSIATSVDDFAANQYCNKARLAEPTVLSREIG